MRARKRPISPQAQAVLDAFSCEEITRVAAIHQLLAIHKAEKRRHIRKVRLSDAEAKELKRITIEQANERAKADNRHDSINLYTIYDFSKKSVEMARTNSIVRINLISYELILWKLYDCQYATLDEVIKGLKYCRKVMVEFGRRSEQHIKDLEKINAARKALKEA